MASQITLLTSNLSFHLHVATERIKVLSFVIHSLHTLEAILVHSDPRRARSQQHLTTPNEMASVGTCRQAFAAASMKMQIWEIPTMKCLPCGLWRLRH